MTPGKQFPLAVVITGVDRFTAPLTRVNDRLAKLTAPVRAFQSSLRRFGDETGLNRLGEQAARVRERLGGVVQETRKLGKELLIGGSIGGFAVGEFFKHGIDRGAGLARQSREFGMSADSLKRYQYIAGHAGVEQDSLNEGLDTFNKLLGQARMRRGKMYEALLPAPHTLRELVTAKDTATAFEIVLRKMQTIPGAQERRAFSSAVGGGADFARLAMTGEELAKLTERYRELYGPQEAFARGAEDVEQSMRDTSAAIEGASNAFLGPFFKGLTSGSEGLTKFLIGHRAQFERWGRELAPKVERFAEQLPARLERIGSFFRRVYLAARPFADLVGGMPNLALLVGGGILLAPWLNSIAQLTIALGTLGGKALWAFGLLRYGLSGAGVAGDAGGIIAGMGAAGRAAAGEGIGAGVAGAAGATGAGGAAAFGLGAVLPLGIVAAAAATYGYVLLPRLIAALTPAEVTPGHVAHGATQESATLRDFFRSAPPLSVLLPGFGKFMSPADLRPLSSHLSAATLGPAALTADDMGALGRRAVAVDISDHSIERLGDELRKQGAPSIAPVKSHVTVELKNAPRGTRMKADSTASIETLMGFTMAEAR